MFFFFFSPCAFLFYICIVLLILWRSVHPQREGRGGHIIDRVGARGGWYAATERWRTASPVGEITRGMAPVALYRCLPGAMDPASRPSLPLQNIHMNAAKGADRQCLGYIQVSLRWRRHLLDPRQVYDMVILQRPAGKGKAGRDENVHANRSMILFVHRFKSGICSSEVEEKRMPHRGRITPYVIHAPHSPRRVLAGKYGVVVAVYMHALVALAAWQRVVLQTGGGVGGWRVCERRWRRWQREAAGNGVVGTASCGVRRGR